VGLWDNLDENTDYAPYITTGSWLLELHDSPFNDSSYVSVNNNNTRFVLLKAGFYKLTLKTLLYTVDPDGTYWIYLLRNGTQDKAFERIAISANPSSTYYYVQSSLYIYSNGFDNFTINCYSLGDPFFISGDDHYNQFSIEYDCNC